MRKPRNLSLPSTGWAVVLALVLAAALPVQAHGERFRATLVDMQEGENDPILIYIEQYSSDEEVAKLRGILAEKGPEALSDALWDYEKGYIRIGGGLGYPIAAARTRDTDSGRVVRIMIDRAISFRELARNARSLDYPFSYIELTLDESGKGEGKMYAAAQVKLENGGVEIESYTAQPLRLLNVQME